jgi:2-keto-4-pentenoate hydratase/2-oxohepta-3-ene-1,7-dioic acid hydratase in catechol pathway
MVWSISEILEYINERVELRCGDVVFTGTTAGVGLEDGRFLQPGDVVDAEIEHIGVLRNTVGSRAR